jgi:predicted Zn finger-like uncharacterized protein
MQITCPACAAAYEVPLALLKPGLKVRCARCAHEWLPTPTQAAPELATEAMPVAPPLTEPAAIWPHPAPPPPAPNLALRLAWVASFVVLLLLGGAAYTQRTSIMRIWPPTVRLYTALGLTVDR